MRPVGSPAELERRRNLIVHRVLYDGYSLNEASRAFGVNQWSIRRWLKFYEGDGEKGLLAQPSSGRPPKLSRFQEKIVSQWIKENPTKFGFRTELWTASRVAQLIKHEFGVNFNSRYLVEWLRDRRFTPQKPQRTPKERNPEEIAHWLRNDWPRIKQKAARKRAFLMLIDESGFFMAPLLRRTWAPRGHPPELKFQKGGKIQKVSVAAAMCLNPKRDTLGLFYKTLIDDYFDSFNMAAFLEAMLRSFKGTIVAIWDGGRNHTGAPIRELLKDFPGKLILEDLPPYAPMLNPVEFVWGWLKSGKLSNFSPKDVWDLDKRIVHELNSIYNHQEMLRRLFHRSKLPLPRTLVS